MKIVLASRNRKKIQELETILKANASIDIEVLSLDDIGYTEEIVEDGASFRENALIKASVPARLGYIGVADDSGLCVDALGGAPGIYSARYSGEDATDASNNEKLLRELSGVPDAARTAHFACTIACVLPPDMKAALPDHAEETPDGLSAFCVSGICPGRILREGQGTDGFGYDPLFYLNEEGKTFAELTPAEKNAVSHRGRAMRAFIETISILFH